MDFHVLKNGQDLGTFPLDELQRRRAVGEYTGTELVWREGMSNWVSLDAVLQAGGTPASAPQTPPPLPVHLPGSRGVPVWGIVLVCLILAVGMGFLAYRTVTFSRQVRRAVQMAKAGDSEGIETAGLPIPVRTNTLTEADVQKRARDFRVRHYLEGYKKYGVRSERWDADAVRFLESWIACRHGSDTNLTAMRRLGDKLAVEGACDDPLVLTIAAVEASEHHEKIRRLQRALPGFEASKHRAYPRLYATVCLALELGASSPRTGQLDQSALKYLRQALSDGSLTLADEEELAEVFVNGWGETFLKRNGDAVCRIVRDIKKFPWLAAVLEGENQIALAWKARGGGYANTVTSQGWQSFSDHLKKARAALTDAWKQHPERPLAPARLIYVALGDSGLEEMRVWFDRALESQIDYAPAWSSFKWGLRPRWHGSHAALLVLGQRAVDTGRFDTDVPRKLFDLVSDVESELELAPGDHIYGREDVWPHLQRMYQGYLREPKQAPHHPGWRTSFAAVAYFAGKYHVARTQLEALNWNPVAENLRNWGADLSLFTLKIAALTGPAADLVALAESSADSGDLAAAIKQYQHLAEASTNSTADDRTHSFARSRLAALLQEQALANGEWISLLPTNNADPNWVFTGDTIRFPAPNSLEVDSGPLGHALYCRTRVGPEFEVTGEFEPVRTSNSDFQAGLTFGLPDSLSSTWYAFRLKQNKTEGQVVSVSYRWSTQQTKRDAILHQGRNSFRFLFKQGRADAWVNGAHVLQKASPSRNLKLDSTSLVGLGAYNDMNQTTIRYSNIKVRRVL